VRIGDFIVPIKNTKVNGFLTEIQLSFDSIPDLSLLNINSEVFISNNDGKDWEASSTYVQFISMDSSSDLYTSLRSSFLLESFSILSSDGPESTTA